MKHLLFILSATIIVATLFSTHSNAEKEMLLEIKNKPVSPFVLEQKKLTRTIDSLNYITEKREIETFLTLNQINLEDGIFQEFAKLIRKNGYIPHNTQTINMILGNQQPNHNIAPSYKYEFYDQKGNTHSILTIMDSSGGVERIFVTIHGADKESISEYTIMKEKIVPFIIGHAEIVKNTDVMQYGYEKLLHDISKK